MNNQMSLNVISKKDDLALNSPVFHVGSERGDDAIAISTSSDRAVGSTQAAGWKGSETVAELQPRDVIQWLMKAAGHDTKTRTVNPVHPTQLDVPQPKLSIPELLEELAQIATDRINIPPLPKPAVHAPPQKLHCQKCGKVVEQESRMALPRSCGREVTVATIV